MNRALPSAVLLLSVLALTCSSGNSHGIPGGGFLPGVIDPHTSIVAHRPAEGLETNVANRRGIESRWLLSPMPLTQLPWPDLGDPEHGSISVATVTNGYLVRGAEVPPTGQHHALVPEVTERLTRWGTDEMVATVLHAASEVAKPYPGSILQVANMARRGGGPIPWSRSHQSGRDVDLLFYMVDAEGTCRQLPTMMVLSPPLGTVLLDGRQLTFDPGRNWALVQSLLATHHGDVEYIFMADFLIRRMHAHARSQGITSAELAALGSRVRQPRGAAPHDDHMHVRIRCQDRDIGDGCREILAGRERIPVDNPLWTKRVQELRQRLASASDDVLRMALIQRMAALKDRQSAATLVKLLTVCSEPLCGTVLETLRHLGGTPRGRDLTAYLLRTNHPGGARLAFELLDLDSSLDASLLLPLLQDQRTLSAPVFFWQDRLIVRERACLTLALTQPMDGRGPGVEVLKVLLPLCADPVDSVAGSCRQALSTLGGGVDVPSPWPAAPKDIERQARRWQQRTRERRHSFARTLKDRGLRVSAGLTHTNDVPALLQAILMDLPVSINAQLALGSLMGHRMPVYWLNVDSPHYLWRKHWKETRGRHR
jgi:penicillin-insensitive murein endopeptidase